jgi:hypothetical protein
MPITLQELTNTKIPSPTYVKRNYTMLDIDDGNETIGTGGIGNIEYNADEVSGAPMKPRIKSSLKYPEDYVKRGLNNFPREDVDKFRGEGMRSVSFEDSVLNENKNYKPVQQMANYDRGQSGMIFGLNDASEKRDLNIKMSTNSKREHYTPIMSNSQTCVDILNHVNNCPMCSKYFKCDTKIYNLIIVIIVIFFSLIIYFLSKEKRK